MAGTILATGEGVRHRKRGVVRVKVNVLTDASGDATAHAVGPVFGALKAIFYDGGLDASATVTIKDEKTGASLVVLTTGTEGTPARYQPTTNVVTNAGATIAADATAPNVWRDIKCSGLLTITVAGGGNVETGIFGLVVDENDLGDGRPLTV